MAEKIRIGIIGAGNIAQSSHLPVYVKHADVELVAVCDQNYQRACEVKEKYGMKYAFATIEELLAISGELDAVSICVWNNAHAKAAIGAAKAGLHVLCEKPMAMTVAEAEAMVQAAKENVGKVFMMGFVNRYRSDSIALKSTIDAGRLGDIYFVRAGILRRRGTPLGWFTDKAKSGGGPVIDIGVHAIDLAWYFMGRPKPISVSATTYGPLGDYQTKGVSRWKAYDLEDLVFNVEDSANGFIRFENGATMNFEVSWAINGKQEGQYSYLYGTKAGASIEPLTIYGEQPSGYLSDETITFPREGMFDNELAHFLDCIRTGKQPISPAEDGLNMQKMLCGIYESAQAGKEILL